MQQTTRKIIVLAGEAVTQSYTEKNRVAQRMVDNQLTSKVIAAAIKVHRILGPGFLESAYRECLYYELKLLSLKVEKEKSMPIIYGEVRLDHGYRLDLLVEDSLVLELKTVECFTDVHFAQLVTYLRFGNYPLGLLINFNTTLLKNGIKRVINSPRTSVSFSA